MLASNGFRLLQRLAPGRPTGFRTWTSISTHREGLTIHALKDTVFPYVWLRDSCQSPEAIHPSTSQKLHRSSDIPLDIRPAGLAKGQFSVLTLEDNMHAGVKVTPDGVEIKWEDGRVSTFSREFLETHSSPENLQKSHLARYTTPQAWTLSTITQTPNLFVTYGSLKDPKVLSDAMVQLLKYGLVLIRGVPTEQKANETCELRTLAKMFGEIRETFYGETWDVINVVNSKNIAYTNLDLGLHMDLLYFHHPPRFQALHCLRNRVIGGTSVFVDALQASHTLFHANRQHFDLLTSTPVAFQYLNDGHHLMPETSMLHFPPSAPPPAISHINYSPPFQGPLPLSTPRKFYPALRHFSDILNDPRNTFTYTLKEGDCVMFDNRRVLHARTAFEEKKGNEREEGVRFGTGEDMRTTNRWLKGCYLEADAVLDRMRVSRTKLGLA
ncbi:gamma-butyrobetaine dioxygenase [Coprinopsis sp. MPI-PUGE-AT-0042]|nr:gamma-butyrobetaine dioxygenase [Coprinopsis sp. MPI-PUGE-AT-0042]